jgi:hypothetical protein
MSNYESASLTVNILYTTATIMLLLVALIQFRHGRRDAAVRASIRILQDESESPDIKAARRLYHEVARKLDATAAKEIVVSPSRELEREALRSITNRYEYISIAIQERAMDFKVYKRMWRSSTIHDWSKLKPFIDAARYEHNNPALWSEFEWLVQRCKEGKSRAFLSPLKRPLSRPPSSEQFDAALPKDLVHGALADKAVTAADDRSPQSP